MNWKGKTAIVTGASGGIGSAVCRKLASMNLNMVITGRNQETLDALACELRETGVNIVSCAGDITDSTFVRSLPNAATERLGGLDVLINCAGTAQTAIPGSRRFGTVWIIIRKKKSIWPIS